MPVKSWAARLPRVYDVVMLPAEALGLRRMRARLWADVPQAGRGLEIGAGSGTSDNLAPAATQIVRIDLSEAMLARARRRGADSGPAVVADVQALPFRAGAFDFIVGSLLFCEVPDPARGLAEVRRVLRRGGSLHLLEHVEPRAPLPRLGARAVSLLTGPLLGEHYDRPTHETVAASGFRIVDEEWRLGCIVRLKAIGDGG